MKTSDILKYPHEIDPQIAIDLSNQMLWILRPASVLAKNLDSAMDAAQYYAAWEHLSAPERAAWKVMVRLGKIYAGQ